MRARTGVAVLVGTAVVLLLVDGGAGGLVPGLGDVESGGTAKVASPADSGGARDSVFGPVTVRGTPTPMVGIEWEGSDTLDPATLASLAAAAESLGGRRDGGRGNDGRGVQEATGAGPNASRGTGPGAAPSSPDRVAPRDPEVRTVERERILVLGSVFFPSGQAELGPDARRLLDGVAATYKGTTQRLEITGHTDTRGSAAVNATLSRARAEAVRGYLAARGIPARQLVVRYAGASRPMARGASSEDNAQNRRVELSVAAEP